MTQTKPHIETIRKLINQGYKVLEVLLNDDTRFYICETFESFKLGDEELYKATVLDISDFVYNFELLISKISEIPKVRINFTSNIQCIYYTPYK